MRLGAAAVGGLGGAFRDPPPNPPTAAAGIPAVASRVCLGADLLTACRVCLCALVLLAAAFGALWCLPCRRVGALAPPPRQTTARALFPARHAPPLPAHRPHV